MNLNNILSKVLSDFKEVELIKTNRASLMKCFKKTYQLAGLNLQLTIGIDSFFPYSLPHFFIENYHKLDTMLPHVETDGYICFLEQDNILLDYENPEGIIAESLDKVLNLLSSSIMGHNNDEVRSEFISYWALQSNIWIANSFIKPTNKIKDIEGSIYKNRIIVFDNTAENNSTIEGVFSKVALKNKFKAKYIPLRSNNNIYPPHYKKGWTIRELKRIILDNLSSSNRSLFNKYRSKQLHKSSEVLIISIPITEKNDALIGIFLQTENRKQIFTNPLNRNIDRFKIIPILVERYDEGYLIERTSSDYSFTNKKVAVIGQGSLGSKVTMELARLGIRYLRLIDNDKLSVDNVNRHELGMDSLFDNGEVKLKVDAMTDELLRKFPSINVEVEELNVLDLIKVRPSYFDEFDCVIIAIGDTMTSLKLNHFFKERKIKAIYSWLEPYGIGGHLLAVNYNNEGCFQCLYTDPRKGYLISNRASLAEEGQDFNKHMASCFSRFVPYGSIAPLKASTNIIEAFVAIIKNGLGDNFLLSWTGDNSLFLKDGFALSNMYYKVKEKEIFKTSEFKVGNCTICRSK